MYDTLGAYTFEEDNQVNAEAYVLKHDNRREGNLDSKTDILSASANAGYNFDNWKDFNINANADATIIRHEVHAGPISIGGGLNADTGFSVSSEGVSANILGFGFSVGRKLTIDLPFGDISFDFGFFG